MVDGKLVIAPRSCQAAASCSFSLYGACMPKSKRYASSTDVAKLAGVSQSTISRAFRPGGRVAAETRDKILAAAAELEYRPSHIPRIMLSHRSNLIALVIGGMSNPVYSAVVEQLTIRLERRGYQALVVYVDSGYRLDDALPRLIGYRVDGVVSPLAVLSQRTEAALSRLKIPVVSFNANPHSDWVSTVQCDNAGAAAAIANLFAARGARRLGFVCGPTDSPAAQARLHGFCSRAVELGLQAPIIVPGDFRYEGGVKAAGALLRRRRRPDAVFCANDLLAFGMIDTARQVFGLRVPRDLMVAGFDDVPEAAWAAYDLTTCRYDADAMCREAIEILHRGLSRPEPRSESITLKAPVIERGSTETDLGGIST